MSSSRGGYQPQACNLCWKELKPPFLLTGCDHVFCMAHRDHQRIQQRSCPGCGAHLSEKGGLKSATFEIKGSDIKVLHGVRPDHILKAAAHSIDFWVMQEQQKLAYANHKADEAERKRMDEREMYSQACHDAQSEANAAKEEKEQVLSQIEELSHENQLLNSKHQDAERRVRVLEETVVQLKRQKRGPSGSPNQSAGPSPGRTPSHNLGPPPRSPLNVMQSPSRAQPRASAPASTGAVRKARTADGASSSSPPITCENHRNTSDAAPGDESSDACAGKTAPVSAEVPWAARAEQAATRSTERPRYAFPGHPARKIAPTATP